MSCEDITEECPYCGADCYADWVDVGFGMSCAVQCGPFYCQACGASQVGPHDSPRELTAEEVDTGYYKPHSPVSNLANTYMGKPVDHVTAKALYDVGLLDKKEF